MLPEWGVHVSDHGLNGLSIQHSTTYPKTDNSVCRNADYHVIGYYVAKYMSIFLMVSTLFVCIAVV